QKQRSQEGEVWLLDREINNAIMNVELQVIVKRVTITVLYNDNVTNCNTIQEILYKYNGHWKLRDVKYSYQHPSEFATLKEPKVTNLPVYKLYIDLYYDDFETFRNVYHSLGGITFRLEICLTMKKYA